MKKIPSKKKHLKLTKRAKSSATVKAKRLRLAKRSAPNVLYAATNTIGEARFVHSDLDLVQTWIGKLTKVFHLEVYDLRKGAGAKLKAKKTKKTKKPVKKTGKK